MKFVKVLFWSTVVAFPLVGFLGCATGALMGAGLQNDGNPIHQVAAHAPPQRPALESNSVRQVQFVSPEEDPATPQNQIARADFIQTAHRVAAAPRVSLITLGPNDNLNEIIRKAQGVILIDYYADWCGPCRKQGTILHDMESQAAEAGALIVKIDIDQHQDLASKFRVSSLPTLMLIKDGQILERQSGIATHKRIATYLRR